MRTTVQAIASVLAFLAASHANAAPVASLAAAIDGTGRAVLPMEVRSGFAFVAGEANGQSGYLMLDTGTPFPVFLNQAFLRLPSGEVVGRGAASSGQKIVVSKTGCLTSLTLAAAFTLAPLCDLPGTDLSFVSQELEPRLLGFLGAGLFSRYRFTLDWRRRQAVLEARSRPVEPGALATLRFTAADRQPPSVTLSAGEVPLPARMDSGDPGHVTLTKVDAESLLKAGRLSRTPQRDGGVRYSLERVEYDGQALDSSDLPVTVSGDRSSVMLGFLFLAKYRSTWDLNDHVVRLYKPDEMRPSR